MSDGERVILHLDMDAFYAAVEQRDNPGLRGKPVLVGGDPRGRGVVSTASYEARPFGCRSAMPMSQAIRLCPQAIIVRPRMQRYVEVSQQVFEILETVTPLIEPLSIDEAFLDVTGSQRLLGDGPTIARDIRRRVQERTQLTASVGVAPSKFVAKLASDLKKPDGLVIVRPGEVLDFLADLPLSRLWGAGPVTQRKFDSLRIRTFGDARRLTEKEWIAAFGELGVRFHYLVRGEDVRAVVPDHEARSLSHENTFAVDLSDLEFLRAELLEYTDRVASRLRRHGLEARTVALKIRRPDFHTITRRATLPAATSSTDLLWNAAAALFDTWAAAPHPVRLLGVGVSHIAPAGEHQLTLFDGAATERRRAFDAVTDQIRERFGPSAAQRGATCDLHPSKSESRVGGAPAPERGRTP